MTSGVLGSAPQAGIEHRDLLAPLMRPDGDGAGDGGRAIVRQALLLRGKNPNVSGGGSLAIAFPIYVEKATVGSHVTSPFAGRTSYSSRLDTEDARTFVTPFLAGS